MAGALPDNAAAARRQLAAGRTALVWRRLVADTETPVGAALKLIEPERGDFLLESVEGGEVRGRYSLLGLAPDLVFRATGTCLRDQPRLEPRSRRLCRPSRRFARRAARAGRILPHRGARQSAADRLPGRLLRLRDDRPGREAAARAAKRSGAARHAVRAPDDNPRVRQPVRRAVLHGPAVGGRHRSRPRDRGGGRADRQRLARARQRGPGERAGGRPARAGAHARHARGRVPRDGAQGEGLHHRGRRVPGRAGAALHLPVPAAPVRALPRAQAREPLAVPLFPRPAGLRGGRLEPRNPCACAEWRSDDPPDRRHPPARRHARGRRGGREKLARRSQGVRRALDAARPRPERRRTGRGGRQRRGHRELHSRTLQPRDAHRQQRRRQARSRQGRARRVVRRLPRRDRLRRAESPRLPGHRRARARDPRALRRRRRLLRARRLRRQLHRASGRRW